MKHTMRIALAALTVGSGVVGITPVAQAQSCGTSHEEGSSRADGMAVLIANGVTCDQARAVFADWRAGKGTQTARNAATVDGYNCVGNPAGIYGETGVLSYCDGNGAHIELRNP